MDVAAALDPSLNKIHEWSLSLLLKNYEDDFQNFLRYSGDIPILQRYINSLLTEVYKYINCLSPEIINKVFSTRQNIFDTRQFNVFQTHIPYKANQLCNLLPKNLKSFPPLALFKNEVKLWESINCPGNIYKNYVPNKGYCMIRN